MSGLPPTPRGRPRPPGAPKGPKMAPDGALGPMGALGPHGALWGPMAAALRHVQNRDYHVSGRSDLTAFYLSKPYKSASRIDTMRPHWTPWGPMGPHGGPIGPHRAPWGPMGPHGGPMGPHGGPWAPMGPHGPPWGPQWGQCSSIGKNIFQKKYPKSRQNPKWVLSQN